MRLAAHWVTLHPVLDPSSPEACFQSPKTLAGEGSPAIDEFTIPDLATILGLTCDAVGSYLTDVIELRHRLPQLWAGVLTGDVTPWRAQADRADHPSPHARGSGVRRRAGRVVRQPPHPHPARTARRPRPRPVHARRPREGDRGRRLIGVMSRSPPTRSPTTAPSTSRPTSRSPTPSASPTPSPPAPPDSPPSARPTPSTAAAPPRWATSPATNKPSTSTTRQVAGRAVTSAARNVSKPRPHPHPRPRRSCSTPTSQPTPSLVVDTAAPVRL